MLLATLFLGGYLFVKFFLSRKVKTKKLRHQYNIRLKYLFFILFMIFFVRIWVDGFKQILAFIGFLAAAITLTQKDTLMNLVGWLIINWRGLFSEEDFIKISHYTGYVKSIGFLYFSLIEASAEFPEVRTGRVIKVPNGFVTKNAITNYSHQKFVECTINFIFKPKGTFNEIEPLFLVLQKEMLNYLKKHQERLMHKRERKEPLDNYMPRYHVKIRQEKPAGYEMIFLFYCRHADKMQVIYTINKLVDEYTASNEALLLAFD